MHKKHIALRSSLLECLIFKNYRHTQQRTDYVDFIIFLKNF